MNRETIRRTGSLGVDADSRIIRVCSRIPGLLGFEEDDLLGKELTSIVPPAGAPGCREIIEGAASGEGVSNQPVTLVKKDGEEVELYLSAYPLREPTGEIHSYYITLSTHQASERPSILSIEFQRIFMFSNDAVALTDKTGAIIDVNRAFLKLYGYEKHEVLGRNPRVLKSEHSTNELYRRMWQDILDPGKGWWRGEIINLAKDGTEVPVLLSINAIPDNDGEVRGFLGIAYDETEKKNYERMMKMYVDFIVHDIRGPLTSIMTYSEILLMQLEDKASGNEGKKLRDIFSSAEKINRMVSDILDFSRLQCGTIPLCMEKVNFGRVLADASQPFEGSGKRLLVNGAPFDAEDLPDLEFEADPDKLTRIVYNLLSNSFKYANSEVRTSWGLAEDGLRFTVTNDGEPITREEAQRVFDLFYQAEDGIRTGGAGLGLSIVKSFVEAHGGRVWAEPGEGGGPSFGFTIPVAGTASGV